MKYKEKEVGTPTLEMFTEYIESKKLKVSPQYVYNYCKKNKWTTKKGTPMQSVEAMVNVLNGIVDSSKTSNTSSNYTNVLRIGVYGVIPTIQSILGNKCPDEATLQEILKQTCNYLYPRITTSMLSVMRGT